MFKYLRKKINNIRQKFNLKFISAKIMITAVVAGGIIPIFTNAEVASATNLNDTLGFNNKINPVTAMNKAGKVAINVMSAIAVCVGAVFLIQAVQAFFQAKDSHDSQQIIQGFGRLFIGIGCVAAGGIAFFFTDLVKS